MGPSAPNDTVQQRLCLTQELAIRYGFPSVEGPSNLWIGIVELGGGCSEKDLDAYCQQLRIDTPKTETTTLRGFEGSYTGEPAASHRMYIYCSAYHARKESLLGLHAACIDIQCKVE